MTGKINELTEKINKDLFSNSVQDAEYTISFKDFDETLSGGYIAIAQTNPTSGDVKNNAQKAYKIIEYAEKLNIDLVVFPELFLVGNPVGDLITKFPIVVEENIEWLQVVAKKAKCSKILIGFVDRVDNKNYNAMAFISNGKVEKIIRKSVLVNKLENNENRIFSSEQNDINSRVIEINSKKFVVLFSENEFDLFDFNKFELAGFIVVDSSISRTGKSEKRNNSVLKFIQKNKKPLLYVNQVGANDCFSFDGESCVYDEQGNIVFCAKSFEEEFCLISLNSIFNSTSTVNEAKISSEKIDKFTLDYEFDLERIYLSVVQSIRDYFRKTGFKRAVLGLSGGLDSTVASVLLVDALGAENVLGISMPSKITSSESKNDAQELAQNLGLNFMEYSIKDLCEVISSKFFDVFSTVENKWDNRYKESFTNDNIQARSRAMILWGVANEFGSCLPIATSDKSELYMGYATINGDMSGGFAPLADITKTKLFALARWLNKNRTQKNCIPESIINKRPGAELAINPKTGKPLLAEEALMPYEFLDEVIWRVENFGETIGDMINSEFLYEKIQDELGQTISKEQKHEWLKKFFRRMSTSVYKSGIMPPFPIVEAHSINKVEYFQPIVSSNVNFEKTSLEEKFEFISKQI